MATIEAIDLGVRDEAIHCSGCESRIQRALGRLPGVSQVRADQQTQKVSLHLEQDKTSVLEIMERLEFLGYPVARDG